MADSEMFRGDSQTFDFVPRDRNRAVIPSSSIQSIWFTGKRLKSDVDGAALFTKTLADGIAAVSDAVDVDKRTYSGYRITLAPADTSGLADAPVEIYYDVRIKDTGNNIHTLDSGTLLVKAVVRQTT
jgi:hypothetical protein